MTKKIVGMLIIALIITSNVAAMLIKAPKFSKLKTSQLGMRQFTKMDIKLHSWGQAKKRCLEIATEQNDGELVGFLLRDDKNKDLVITDDLIKKVKSLEMMQLFVNHGFNIQEVHSNEGNFLHHIIGQSFKDDRLIIYALEKGVDPKALDSAGNNLWHRLLGGGCVWPEDVFTLMHRAKLLHPLHINPYLKNKDNISAIDMLKKLIEEKIEYIEYCHDEFRNIREADFQKLDCYQKILKMMQDKNFTQEKINKE
jgi:hypothetical protein